MYHCGRLHGEHDEQLLHCCSGRLYHSETETLRPSDHLAEKLVDRISVNTGAFGNARAQLVAHATQKPRCRKSAGGAWVVRKDPPQILIVVGRPSPGKMRALLLVVVL